MAKMKIAHYVCFDKKFIPAQIDFLNEHFATNLDQTFYVHGATESYLNNAPKNVVSISKLKFLQFVFDAHRSDRIIFNGLFYRKVIVVFALMPWLIRKAIWIPWGGDLYWRLYEADSKLKTLFLKVKGYFVRRLYAIATGNYGDYETVINWYGNGPKYINSGCNIFEFDHSDLDLIVNSRVSDAVCRIQVGNSGDRTNDHLGAMESLRRFSAKDILIYACLSYGDRRYAEMVIKEGRALFGKRFIPMTQFMSPAEYNNHLSTIDVLILNHRRQQGFGNIAISLYLGAKVFIRRDVSLWSYLTEVMGCVVNETDSIRRLNYEQLIENDLETIRRNRRAVAHLFSREWQKGNWAELYSG